MNTYYDATGMTDTSLRYAKLSYDGVNNDGTIGLTLSKWREGNPPGEFSTDTQNPWAGMIVFSFSETDFYQQIDSIQFQNGTYMQKSNNGATWTVPANDVLQMGLIGVVTNSKVTIKLKDGATLESLGLADDKISYEMVLINNKGQIATEGVSTGYIQQNNDNIKNEKTTDFTKGVMTNTIVMDTDQMRINSVHTWKPNQNYLQTDYGWVVYIREQVPEELLPFIDITGTQLYNSDGRGQYVDTGRTKWSVNMTEDGKVDTSTDPALSLAVYGDDLTLGQLNQARSNTNDIFWGTLGQSRSYTISYKLKDGVTLKDFTDKVNDLVTNKGQQLYFESSMAADYQNKYIAGGLLGKADNGAPFQQLTNSYANSYLQANDKDQDGIFDFVEFQFGYNYMNVDTDGDGVPDPQELYTDQTDGTDAGQYKVSDPTTETTSIVRTAESTITGTMPKTVYDNPADATEKIHATNEAAGNAIVKLV